MVTESVSRDECGCGVERTLIYACSGGSNVGQLANAAAVMFSGKDGAGMSCLAGIGGNIPTMIITAKAASKVLVIDGCPLSCGKKSLNNAGIEDMRHLVVTDLEIEKNYDLDVRDEDLEIVVGRIREMLTE